LSIKLRIEQNHIDFELKQKDTLLREVHHRIKNTLQGVMNLLQQHKNKQNFDRYVFEHAITQLYSVSLIHGINGESSDDKVELSNLVNLICVTAFNISGFDYTPSYSLSKSHIINTIDNNTVAIALIINELIINAIKYTPDARINEIKVNVITLLDDAVIEIRNPGKSLPKDFDFKNGTGLGTGLTLIRSLLPKQGTEITIRQTAQEVVCHLILKPPILENIYEFKGYRENKSA
jgi:two-component sensor histidine kinase